METDSNQGILEYLRYIENGGEKGKKTWKELAREYGIGINQKDPGDNAKKIWNRFKRSNLSADIYYAQRYAGKYYSPKIDERDAKNILENEKKKRKTWEENLDTGRAQYSGVHEFEDIPTIPEAVAKSKVDAEVWEAYKMKYEHWDVHMKIRTPIETKNGTYYDEEPVKRTNYLVMIEFKRRVIPSSEIIENILKESKKWIDTITFVPSNRVGRVGVASLADFHLGAEVKNLLATPDFNPQKLIEYLNRAAHRINSYNYDRVYVAMLGDFFESLSGLNHLNTFKSLIRDGYGGKIIIWGGQIYSDFLRKIKNLDKVFMVAGNHDRITQKADIDNEGAGAEVLAQLIRLENKGMSVDFHPYLISEELDGLGYLFGHGQFKMSNKGTGDIIVNFGNNDLFTLWIEGHWHTRRAEKTWRKYPVQLETYQAISADEANYRKYTAPPIFTGNYYSETGGWTSSGGILISQHVVKNKPDVFDLAI